MPITFFFEEEIFKYKGRYLCWRVKDNFDQAFLATDSMMLFTDLFDLNDFESFANALSAKIKAVILEKYSKAVHEVFVSAENSNDYPYFTFRIGGIEMLEKFFKKTVVQTSCVEKSSYDSRSHVKILNNNYSGPTFFSGNSIINPVPSGEDSSSSSDDYFENRLLAILNKGDRKQSVEKLKREYRLNLSTVKPNPLYLALTSTNKKAVDLILEVFGSLPYLFYTGDGFHINHWLWDSSDKKSKYERIVKSYLDKDSHLTPLEKSMHDGNYEIFAKLLDKLQNVNFVQLQMYFLSHTNLAGDTIFQQAHAAGNDFAAAITDFLENKEIVGITDQNQSMEVDGPSYSTSQ